MKALRSLGLALALGACLAPGADAAKKPKPPLCDGGRFLVQGKRLVGAQRELGGDAIVVSGTLVAIDSGCPQVEGKLEATRKGTRVTAKWKSCAGAKGRVQLTANIDAATCSAVKGTVKEKSRRKRFTAARPTPPGLIIGPMHGLLLSGTTLGTDGGTIEVTDPGSPLAGLRIEVPPGAVPEEVTFSVRWADVEDAGNLPAGAFPASKMIELSATGSENFNRYRVLAKPAVVTLPYDPPSAHEEWVRFYVSTPGEQLQSAGFLEQDLTNHTLTFLLGTFADQSPEVSGAAAPAIGPVHAPLLISEATLVWAIGWFQDAPNARTIGTGFLPAKNGWRIPNSGSYYDLTRGGSCYGMSGVAQHHFARRWTPQLYDSYLDNWPNVATPPSQPWSDDQVAIQYAARAQYGLNSAWATLNDIWDSPISGSGVMRTIIGALLLTNTPVILRVTESIPMQIGHVFLFDNRSHVVLVYRADIPKNFEGNVDFHVYDPNFPGETYDPNDPSTGPHIVWNSSNGFDLYAPGNTTYNNFTVLGFHAAMTNAQLDDLKRAADQSFANDSVFPTIRITSMTDASDDDALTEGNSATTGEHKWITEDTAIRIRGTITGGLATSLCCKVNTASIFVGTDVTYATVNNGVVSGDGSFEAVVPIPQGENELVIIGGNYKGLFTPDIDYWSAYWRDVVDSKARPAAIKIELSWDKDLSDVDLYVKEPDGGGKTGDTVSYSHRRGVSTTNPYLDVDNTSGRGPEHYIGAAGMKTLYTDGTAAANLFGQYTVKAHYYADHDDDPDTTQPIGYTLKWRYMTSCPAPCDNPDKQGRWVEGSSYGQLSEANSSNAGDITNTGPDWSVAATFDYQPDPAPVTPPRQANVP